MILRKNHNFYSKTISDWKDEECGTEEIFGYEGREEKPLYPNDNRCIEESFRSREMENTVRGLRSEGLLNER